MAFTRSMKVLTRGMKTPPKAKIPSSPPLLKKKSKSKWEKFLAVTKLKLNTTKRLLRKIESKIPRLDLQLLREGVNKMFNDHMNLNLIRTTLECNPPCDCYEYDGWGYDHILDRSEYFWSKRQPTNTNN